MRESFFTKRTKETFSGKTPEQLDRLHTPDLAYDTDSFEESAGVLEKALGGQVKEAIRKGKDNPDWYEKFKPHFEFCTEDNVLTLVYTGLSSPDTVDVAPDTDESWQEIFARESLSEKAAAAGMKAFRGPQPGDLHPRQGFRAVFHGPAARAAHSREQFIRVSEMVQDETLRIAEDFMEIHKGIARVRIWGTSAGTYDAMMAARRIGDLLGRPVDDCTLISPGTSLALGIFAAWPASPAADSLKEAGYTPQSFHEAVYEYTQEAHLKEGAHLPRGRNLRIFYGDHDTVIPPRQPGGTLDFVQMAREQGLAPTVVEYKGLDHVTMPGEMLWQQAYGNDPLFIHNKPSLWAIPESYTDPICRRELDRIFSRFAPEELPFFAEAVSRVNGTTMESDMDPYMRTISRWLIDNGLCNVSTGPRYLWVRNKQENIDSMDGPARKRHERTASLELKNITNELKRIEQDPDFRPLYEMTQEERRPQIAK